MKSDRRPTSRWSWSSRKLGEYCVLTASPRFSPLVSVSASPPGPTTLLDAMDLHVCIILSFFSHNSVSSPLPFICFPSRPFPHASGAAKICTVAYTLHKVTNSELASGDADAGDYIDGGREMVLLGPPRHTNEVSAARAATSSRRQCIVNSAGWRSGARLSRACSSGALAVTTGF